MGRLTVARLTGDMTETATPTRLVAPQIRLAARPVGEPRPTDLELVRAEVPEPADGQLLVRNTWMSVDPYMRGRMDDQPSYIPPFALGAPLDGHAVGEVLVSRSPAVPVGATVVHFLGWRTHAVVDAGDVTVVDPELAPVQAHLGVLGTPGLTAWLGLTETAPVRPGDVVFVSAAAGAVGSVAGQLARRLGASRVIGSAGGADKAARLVAEFGFDHGIDRHAGPIGRQLEAAAPDGIDVYFDNVGGDHLDAALDALRVRGRVALVGGIVGYNAVDPVPGPDLYRAVKKRLTLRGLLVTDHLDRTAEWVTRAARWLADGSLRTTETVYEGLESAPDALLGVLRGTTVGKALVRL
jgi:NADPH-dependent curcumin reductase CurA